jgi:hypothetical protein
MIAKSNICAIIGEPITCCMAFHQEGICGS